MQKDKTVTDDEKGTTVYVEMTSRARGAIGMQSATHYFELTNAAGKATQVFHACTDWLASNQRNRENFQPEFIYRGTLKEAQAHYGGRNWPTQSSLIRLDMSTEDKQ